MAKRIKLAGTDSYATIDDEDHALVTGYEWRLLQNGCKFYASAIGSPSCLFMHSLIMGANPPGMVMDHCNGDGLDNRRGNLRFATSYQNSQNAAKTKRKVTSRFKGVSRKGNRWHAAIGVDGKTLRLGSFKTEYEAAMAYDAVARLQHGAFACVNFPRPGERNATLSCQEEAS